MNTRILFLPAPPVANNIYAIMPIVPPGEMYQLRCDSMVSRKVWDGEGTRLQYFDEVWRFENIVTGQFENWPVEWNE